MFMILAAPAYSGDAVQMWKCEMDDDASEQDVKDGAAAWLNAAKQMPGGEGLEAYVLFPIAVNATGETDVMFVVIAPSFEQWGKFWDSYGGSKAAAIDKQNEEFVVCPDSAVWESFKLE
jgi:hypothetical protein